MSLTKLQIRTFLLEKKGYLKKSPIQVAKALWKNSNKSPLQRSKADLQKELELIKSIQTALRTAQQVIDTEEEKNILDVYDQIIAEKNRPKRRLFFDIEVSANIVFAWRVGYKINILPESIINERAIICISYKWEGEDKVQTLKWNKGDDKELIMKFSKIINNADEIVTQNGDKFDIKWLRTRCLYHGIELNPKFNSIDTLKMARGSFNFNSNKLDYMGKFVGEGQKNHTSLDLWKKITLENCKKSMAIMVAYCEQDVILLEKVYHKLKGYCPVKKFRYAY